MKPIVIVCALVVALAGASLARAEPLRISFRQTNAPNAPPFDTSSQYSLLVGQASDGAVDFSLRNSETIARASSITAVQLFGRNGFVPSSEGLVSDGKVVAFAAETSPQRLAGLSDKPNPFFGARSNAVTGSNAFLYPLGINSPQESLTVRARLKDGVTFADVASGLADGSLGVAIRVQNITSPDTKPGDPHVDFSGVFVTQPFASEPPEVTALPLPAVAPACAAIFGICVLRRARSRGRDKVTRAKDQL